MTLIILWGYPSLDLSWYNFDGLRIYLILKQQKKIIFSTLKRYQRLVEKLDTRAICAGYLAGSVICCIDCDEWCRPPTIHIVFVIDLTLDESMAHLPHKIQRWLKSSVHLFRKYFNPSCSRKEGPSNNCAAQGFFYSSTCVFVLSDQWLG